MHLIAEGRIFKIVITSVVTLNVVMLIILNVAAPSKMLQVRVDETSVDRSFWGNWWRHDIQHNDTPHDDSLV
jgi:hypothetical protein